MAQNFDPNQNFSSGTPLPSNGGTTPNPAGNYAQETDRNYGYQNPPNSSVNPQNFGVDPNSYSPAGNPDPYAANQQVYNQNPPQNPYQGGGLSPDPYNNQMQPQTYDPNAYNPGYNDINNAPYGVQPTPAQNFESNLGSPNGAFAPANQTNGYNPTQETPGYYDPAQNYSAASYSVNQAPEVPTYYQDPNNPNNNYEAPNTFIEKKSGNKFLTWLVVFIIVILLAVSGVLFFLSRNRSASTDTASTAPTSSDPNLASSSISSSESSSSSSTTSSAQETPAQLAKIRTSTTIPATWLSQKFSNNGVDATGVCTNQNICGDAADPDDDGLSNLDEYNYDTDPQNDDTDSDGISDGNEIYIYQTSPKLKDSDRDGVADFAELVACNDPIKMSTTKTEAARLDSYKQNTELKQLKAATIKSFNANGATASDLTKGYLEAPCIAAPIPSSASSAPAASSTSGPSISL